MKFTVVMADPAGNRTAIVRSGVPKSERAKVAAAIMADPALRAEQVGFETRPLYGKSLGRLEMAGGEFCGNAARSFGYLLCKEKEIDHCKIEMSGTREQLEVICDFERETSAAQMPMPEKLEMAGEEAEELYPLVVSRGITHMICVDKEFDEAFARRMIDKFGKAYSAFGVMFVNGDSLIPVVYVSETDTVCCDRDEKDGFHGYNFEQPGGTITVNMAKRQGRYAGTVGGKLTLEEPVTMEIED